MDTAKGFLVTLVLFVLPGYLSASHRPVGEPGSAQSIWQRGTLTGGFFGFNDELSEAGIELNLSTTQIYQQNVHGGLSTHRRAGRFSGSYDLELSADLKKLVGLEAATVYMLTEGSFSNGIDPPAVGSYFGVNDDAAGCRSIDVTEFWYEQALLGERIRLRIGKVDLTGGFEHHGCPVAFDCSNYANDENTQFLNSALVNNPTIPFPDNGLAVAVHCALNEFWYASAAVADAQADVRETGFRTAFHGEDYFFYIFETGITPELQSSRGPLQGAYRVGLWYDPQDKEEFSGGKTRRDDSGFFVTCNQMIYRENSEDDQGMGLFGRFGWADGKVNEVAAFFSAGVQYQGLLPDREDDVVALGFAHGTFSDRATDFTDDYESVMELYYKAQITRWFYLSPAVQYVTNPGGAGSSSDALVLGVRAQIIF